MASNSKHSEQHNIEIHQNLNFWDKKPVLHNIYIRFYKLISSYINNDLNGLKVELGSGIGNLKMVVPDVICTDIFDNPWIDQTENAYQLSFKDESVSNIIMFDVWHHLKYPGNALQEFHRVLQKNGRIIIFEPAMSLLGFIAYGLFHHEPLGYRKTISWYTDNPKDLHNDEYYAAQSNASKVFCSKKYYTELKDWNLIKTEKITSISYILSGGYSKPQLFPSKMLNFLNFLDKICGSIPFLFSTRLLIVLDKK